MPARFAAAGTALANQTTYTESPGAGSYVYRVVAYNKAGDNVSNSTGSLVVP